MPSIIIIVVRANGKCIEKDGHKKWAFNTHFVKCSGIFWVFGNDTAKLTTLMRPQFSFPSEIEMQMQSEFSAVRRDLVKNYLDSEQWTRRKDCSEQHACDGNYLSICIVEVASIFVHQLRISIYAQNQPRISTASNRWMVSLSTSTDTDFNLRLHKIDYHYFASNESTPEQQQKKKKRINDSDFQRANKCNSNKWINWVTLFDQLTDYFAIRSTHF